MIYLVTVNYYSSALVTRLINSLPIQLNTNFLLIIINNSPDDADLGKLQSKQIIIINTRRNLGFGEACNLALDWIYEKDPLTTVWLVNPDTYMLTENLEIASTIFNNYQEISILGTRIIEPNGICWFSGGDFNQKVGKIVVKTNSLTKSGYRQVKWVSGCSLLINLRKFKECPKFSSLYFLYYEDFDFCIRYQKKGHIVGITDEIILVHTPSSITNRNIMLKMKYSTCSYLIVLTLYSNRLALAFRFIVLLLNTIQLCLYKPKKAQGKILGIALYMKSIIKYKLK